jgi:hypothetical protein
LQSNTSAADIKRCSLAPQVVQLFEDLTELNFTAEETGAKMTLK